MNAKTKTEKALILHEQADSALVVHGTEDAPQGIGLLRKPKEGEPLYGEVITLSKREDGFYNMERMNTRPHGPVKVASPAYRANFDSIFPDNKFKEFN